ncbi:MAG: peptidase M56, partial [Firmicutes bacterium]|nr:peptidase M56 [Bacillota bacterium]
MSLLQMSLSGGAMILAAVLIRALALHRLPKRIFLAIWGLVLIRLLVPFSLPAECSIYSLLDRAAPRASAAAYSPPVPHAPLVWAGDAPASPPAPGSAPFSIEPWGALWLAGLLACVLYFSAAYIKCRREFREALPVHNAYVEQWIGAHRLWRPIAVRQSDKITAPLTYGILHPVILLPKSTDWMDTETLDYVLTHEW